MLPVLVACQTEAMIILAATPIGNLGDASRRLIEAFVQQSGRAHGDGENDARLKELTAREREVLTLVGQGLSNSEIAQRLVLSPLTAKTHVAHMFMKLAARDRAQLVVLAYETGLVIPGRA